MRNKKRFYRSTLFLATVGTAIGSVLAELFTNLKILTAIFKFLTSIKNLLVKFFSASISVPLWIFILLLIPSIVVIIFIIDLLTTKKVIPPNFFNYIQDEFDGIVWRWVWHFNKFSKKYSIEDLIPFCPKCDCQLLSAYPSGFKCPNCYFEEGVYHKTQVELELIIRQRARKLISQNQE